MLKFDSKLCFFVCFLLNLCIRYDGDWVDDKACGQGKIWHSNGDYYEGEWRDDMANGRGIYRGSNGSR